MTKLVVVLAAVVVVILVVVIVAARNMRAEDPDEFADGPADRDMARGGRGGRDVPYDREPAAMRAPGRGARGSDARGPDARGTPPRGLAARGAAARGPDSQPRLMAAPPAASSRAGRPSANGRGFADGGDQWAGSPDEPTRAYAAQPEAPAGYDDHLSGPLPTVPSGPRRRPGDRPRREGNGTGPQRRPEPAQAPAAARPARSRRSTDTSEWDSSDWDKLSDVDYWAELASEKPLTTTAQPAASTRPARPAQRPAQRQPAQDPAAETPTAASRPTRHGAAPRRDPDGDPTVRNRRPSRADSAAAARGPAGMLPAPTDQRASRHTGPPSLPPPGSLPGPSSLPEVRPDPPRTAGPPSLPRGAPAAPGLAPARGHRRADSDDDPLTSPSFPQVPGDSRSYRNGRNGNSSRSATSPQQYPPAPTEQFPSYPPVPQRPAAQYGAGASPEASRANPYGYQNGAAAAPDPYPGPAATAPAARPGPSGNPYGSYVTPDSPAASPGYGGYSPAPVNGNGYPPAAAGDNTALTDNYWGQQRQGRGAHSAGSPDYLNDPPSTRQSAAAREPGYGYGQQDPAGYGQGGYPPEPGDAAGYPSQDPYRGDGREPGPPHPGGNGYGGYPGYGTGR